MSSEVPEWLNARYLEVALQGGEAKGPPVTVTRFSACPAVAAGTNFLSRLYRVHVEYKRDGANTTTSLIIKVPLTEGTISSIVDQALFYSREPNVYRILPLLSNFIGQDFGPKSFYITDDNTIIMSDLKNQDFENKSNQYRQLDFAHCKQSLITLAQFHAASVKLCKDYPVLINDLTQEVLYTHSECGFIKLMQNCLETVGKLCEEMDLHQDAVRFISARAQTVGETVVRLCQPTPTGLNVLNHGDLWSNNILFNHSQGMLHVRFVDFQLTKYASPVLDLLHFIWTSADECVRENRIPELYETYIHTLNTSLELLGCTERMSNEELQENIRDNIDWAVYAMCCFLPVLVTDTEVIDFEEVASETASKMENLKNSKQYRALLPKLVKHLFDWIPQDLLRS